MKILLTLMTQKNRRLNVSDMKDNFGKERRVIFSLNLWSLLAAFFNTLKKIATKSRQQMLKKFVQSYAYGQEKLLNSLIDVKDFSRLSHQYRSKKTLSHWCNRSKSLNLQWWKKKSKNLKIKSYPKKILSLIAKKNLGLRLNRHPLCV